MSVSSGRSWRRSAVVGAFLALGAGLAAIAGGNAWLFSPSPGAVEVTHDSGNPWPGPLMTVRVERGEVASGQVPLKLRVTLQATGLLTQAVLQTASDANGNSLIDPGEWVTCATAAISESGGVTIAESPVVLVGASFDAYRARTSRTDIGITDEEWYRNPDVSPSNADE